ncbi:MAG: CHAD domain-containing protein [Chloroflexota bacterium]
METEAKFIVPGEATFSRLRGVERFGPYEKRGEKVKTVHDRYIDTTDHRFYHQQLYLRLRQIKDGELLVTLKRLGKAPQGAIHSRDEYEISVSSLDRGEWPQSEVRDMINQIAGDEAFVELVSVGQTRTVSILHQGDRPVAELSLDEVTIQTAHEPVIVYELEAELLPDGLASDLRILVHVFADEYGLDPQPMTKFERAISMAGLAEEPKEEKKKSKSAGSKASVRNVSTELDTAADDDMSPLLESGLSVSDDHAEDAGNTGTGAITRRLSGDAAPVTAQEQPADEPTQPKKGKREMGISPDDSMDTAGRKIIGAYFDDMLSNEEGTAEGDNVEAVHDMRVATRRMRSALQVLEPYLHSKHPTEVRRGLSAVADSLGRVRDLDVLIIHADEFRSQLPEEQQADLDDIIDDWSSERKKARKQLVRLLDSKDYGRFKKRMNAFLEEKEKAQKGGADVEPYQVRHIAPSAILTRYEAVRAYETVMGEKRKSKDERQRIKAGEQPSAAEQNGDADLTPTAIAPTVDQLHALRISGKYLRYTLECFRETLPHEAKGLIKDVVKMQDQLGELHDADVAVTLTKGYIEEQEKKRKKKDPAYVVPAGLAAYLEEREAAIRRIHADFFSTWSRLQSPEWRARLAAVIMA